jgi:hypothetical protein
VAVSAGNLDALVGLRVPVPDLSGITLQSYTITGSHALGSAQDERIATATVDTTNPGVYAGAVHDLSEMFTIVAVDDQKNTFQVAFQGDTPGPFIPDFFVVGYTQNALLLSLIPSGLIAFGLDFSQNQDIELLVLSSKQLASGTPLSFSVNGSFLGSTSPPPPTPGLGVLDTTTGQSVPAAAQPYPGPVANLQEQ